MFEFSRSLLYNRTASLTLQETRSIHDSMNRPKLNSLLIFTFDYKYLKYRKLFIINENKQVFLLLLCNRINGLVGV